MNANISRICYILLLFRYDIDATEVISSNETHSENRNPRVSGRIVKLYSGTRPEPIYCPQEGFQADPTNCAVFYRCVRGANDKFTVFRFQCGPGTVFDPDTEVCNFPRSTRRSECGGILSSAAEKGNENEIEGFNSELPSPINSRPTYSEATEQSTAYPWATSKQDNIYSSSTAAWMTTALYQKLPPQPSRQEDDACNTDGFMGDSRNCRKFYRCVGNQRGGFIRYEFSCSETTVWDDEAQSCNHPWAVKRSRCSRSDSDSISKPSSQQQMQINYGDKLTQSQTQIAHGPVMQNQAQINNGNRDKNKQNSQAKQNQTQVSQSQMQVNHGNGVQSQLQIDRTKESSQAQAQIYETTSKSSTISMAEFENEQDQVYGQQSSSQENTHNENDSENIDNECTESGFMGDTNDCKKFYRCVDNGRQGYIRYEFSCGEGTVWDSSIEACNHVWAVKDCGGKAPQQSSQGTSQTTTTTKPNTQTTTETTINDNSEDPGYGGQTPQSETTSQATPATPKPVKTTTVSSSTSGPTCTSSGFMGDSDDCKKFYRCVDNGNGGYIRYEFSCGEGTVWDTEIETCNHAWAVRKCGGESSDGFGDKETTSSEKPTTSGEGINDLQPSYPVQSSETTAGFPDQPEKTTTTTSKPLTGKECTQEGFVGDENDCKKFYRCVDNGRGGFTKYEFTCGEGTVWDSEITACSHPSSDNTCGTQTSPSTEPNRENDEMYSETSSTQQSQTTEISSQKPQSSNDKCTAEGFYGDSKDCKKFFRCVDNGKGGYTKYDFTCGDGTIWDQEIQACNHQPSDSNCSQQNSQSESLEGEPGITSSTTEKEQFTQETQTTATASSGKCKSEGFHANTEDCRKFYRCVDNGKGGYTKYEFSCGEGTMWVQEMQTCDHDTGEMCNSQNSPPTQTTEKNGGQMSSTSSSDNIYSQPPDNQNDETPDETSSPNSNAGSDKCTSEGFYANQHDCKKFYRCVDNGHGGYTKYDFTCGEGTAWDSDIQSCNHIEEVKNCQGQEQGHDKPMQDEEVTQSPGSTTQSSTSGPATEGSKPYSNDTCKQEGYYGNSQDCTKFYRCVDNGKGGFTKYDFSCGEGTIWDQDITACNHPQDVSNPSCTQSENGDSSTTSSSSSSTSTSSTTESNSESSDCSQQPTKKPDNNNVNCTEAGYYPDPSDCKKFYRCVDWDGDGKRFSVYYFECGEGTIWDPALDTCNHEDSVYPPRDCSGTQSQGETVDKEPSTTETATTTSETETTQGSTTEQSTTQDSTTSDHITTEQNTTTEPTTTQKTTTSKQSTTQQTTTQESTTSEYTTTQYPPQTTEQSKEETTTTQQTTTTQETETQESTTQQSDTTEHTTESSADSTTTTSESTTVASTTESSTTESSTTESSTTESSTTESSTTESSTTEGTTSQTDETESTESSTTESSGDVTTESSTSDKECPSTDDDQNLFVCPSSFKRHPKYCNMFYQCTEDDDTHDVQIATFRCPNDTIYDESKTQCVEEKKADEKCKGEIAQKRRVKRLDTFYKEPIVVTNERLKCPSPGHYPFEKGECSPAFLKCQKTKSGKIRGYIYQCPQGYVYWSVSRRCESKSNVRDCKNSHNNWNGRWEIPIERRNVAP